MSVFHTGLQHPLGVAGTAEQVAAQGIALLTASRPVGQLLVAVLHVVRGRRYNNRRYMLGTHILATPYLALVAVYVVVFIHGNNPQASFLALRVE